MNRKKGEVSERESEKRGIERGRDRAAAAERRRARGGKESNMGR